VFPNTPRAKSHVGLIKLAYSTGNADMARSLDKRTPVTEDGKLEGLPEFSVMTIPYDPAPGVGDDDELKDESDVT
jgi:hypothetical protein